MLQLVVIYLLIGLLTQIEAQIGVGSGRGPYGGLNEDLEDYCYRNDQDPYIYFGTKTSYESLTKRGGQQHIVPGCQPVQFWSINRHGTRLPKASKIQKLRRLQGLKEEIIRNSKERKSYPTIGRLCLDDDNLLKRWRWNDSITEDRAASLTLSGLSDLRLLARRYRSKFPQLFNQPYSDEAYYFQYTQSDRTHDSYQAYIEGLFNQDYYRVHANTAGNDMLLKPYRNCKEWQEKVEQNPETDLEYRRFLESEQYQNLVDNVYRRLGFRYSLNASLIQDMYDMCRFDKAWQVGQPSSWCAAFTKPQLEFLEYGEDIKEYYNSGYGNKLVENIGCGPLQDMYRKFEKTVQGYPDGNKVTALFTHGATMQAVYTTMGIAKDYKPLKIDNYREQQRRMWRTTFINPFASNLVAVLYQCQSSGQPGNNFKVMFFLNEDPIEEFLGCSVGLCDWTTVENKFREVVENCNVDAFCDGLNSASTITLSIMLMSIALVLILLKNNA